MRNENNSRFYLFKKRECCFVFDCLACTHQIVEPDLYDKYLQETSGKSSPLIHAALSESHQKIEPVRPSVKPNISHISIFITDKCNLECSYCYVSKSNIEISSSFVPDLIEFLKCLETPVISLNFTGGEPLIYSEVIKEVVENCQDKVTGKQFVFSLNTNATLVDDLLAKYFARNQFLIMVGMDGEINFDISKSDKSCKNNYEKILAGVKAFRNAGINPAVRATLTPSLKLVKLYDNLLECGFCQAFIGIPALQTCHDKCATEQISIKEFQVILSEYEEIFLEELHRFRVGQPTLFIKATQYLRKRSDGTQNCYYSCGAMLNSISISADGSIYPCHRFVGKKFFIIGKINDRLYIEQIEFLLKQYDSVITKCRFCWARNICKRGCFWESADDTGFQQKRSDSCEVRRSAIETIIFMREQISKVHDNL